MLLYNLKTIKFQLLLCLLIVTACGFSPVYSQKDTNEDIAAKLATIRISPIKSILGQEYVNALQDVLDPAHLQAVPEYVINATLTKDTQALAIERDRTVTRYKVIIFVDYKLQEIATGKIISSGKIKNEADYDKVNSDYATYVSENATAIRAIRELAQDTKIRIISALINPNK